MFVEKIKEFREQMFFYINILTVREKKCSSAENDEMSSKNCCSLLKQKNFVSKNCSKVNFVANACTFLNTECR